jgi:hypothetical protein
MKILLLLAISTFLFKGYKPESTLKTYDLSTAIKEGIVVHNINGNSESPHYYQPLTVSLKNITDDEILIKIPVGQTFVSRSGDHQDILTTKEELIAIKAKGNSDRKVFGMCIQQSNAAPNKDEAYDLGKMASGNLLALSKEIQSRKAFHVIGQNAVWALTDGNDLNEINGYDKKEAAYLKTFVADLKGVPVPDYPADDYYENNPLLIKRRVGGRFKYKFSKTSSVTIGMFDEQGIIVRELYSNPKATPGERTLKYAFDEEVHTDDVYYIRLIVDGQIKINFEMKS